CDRCSLVPVEGDENGASATPDVDVSRSDRHGKAPEGAQAVPGLWSSAPRSLFNSAIHWIAMSPSRRRLLRRE
ncbi:MAG: hypothetical protein V2A73_02270, partial [Pseudomonadota bacterium]